MLNKIKTAGGVIIAILTITSTVLSIVGFGWDIHFFQVLVKVLALYTPELVVFTFASCLIIFLKNNTISYAQTLILNLKPNDKYDILILLLIVFVFCGVMIQFVDYEYSKARTAKYIMGPIGIQLLSEEGNYNSAAAHAEYLSANSSWERFSNEITSLKINLQDKAILNSKFSDHFSTQTGVSKKIGMESALVGQYLDSSNKAYKKHFDLLKSNGSNDVSCLWEQYVYGKPNKLLQKDANFSPLNCRR